MITELRFPLRVFLACKIEHPEQHLKTGRNFFLIKSRQRKFNPAFLKNILDREVTGGSDHNEDVRDAFIDYEFLFLVT